MKQFLSLLAISALMALATSVFATEPDIDATATSHFNTNVTEMAVLNITAGAVDLVLVAPATGGAAIAAVSDHSTYAQYTSVIGVGTTRTLDARISTGTLPTGTTLTLLPAATAGNGTKGTSVSSAITLGTVGTLSGTTAASIVTGIGSCNTGVGATDGVKLTYELSVQAIGSLKTTATNDITITYTLTDSGTEG